MDDVKSFPCLRRNFEGLVYSPVLHSATKSRTISSLPFLPWKSCEVCLFVCLFILLCRATIFFFLIVNIRWNIDQITLIIFPIRAFYHQTPYWNWTADCMAIISGLIWRFCLIFFPSPTSCNILLEKFYSTIDTILIYTSKRIGFWIFTI